MQIRQLFWLVLFYLFTTTAGYAATAVPLFNQALPPLPENQEVLMLTVEYAPGESSTAHRHNAYTYVYVLQGSIGMQVEGGVEQQLSAGQTFYEIPSDVHVVSKNMSTTETAKFLVLFIKTVGAPTSAPVQ